MPTRRERNAPVHRRVDLEGAGGITHYSPHTLRTMMFRSDDPPPLFKYRGRWFGYEDELQAWIERREGAA